MSDKCPECKSKKVNRLELADSQFEPYDELTCLKCGNVWYETPSEETIQEWHDLVIKTYGLEESFPRCQNCNQPMDQLPDDQIGEGWEYWHCELCHGGEPFKAGHYDRPT